MKMVTLVAVVAVMCLVAACAPAAPTPTTAPPTPTHLPPTPTPTPPPPAPTAVPTEAVWDLVFISDSSGWGVAELYAAHIETDLGVTVRVHDKSRGGLPAGQVLRALHGDWGQTFIFKDLPDVIREAEVVLLEGNPEESVSGTGLAWDCTIISPWVDDCSPKAFDTYKAHLDAIFEQILALRNGAPIVVRAYDLYVPILSWWKDAGLEAECMGCWENFTAVIHQAAADHNVPVARVWDAFNGPNHDQDPRDKGYIGSDGIHTSDAGQQAIADLLRDLGYEYTAP
jgi:hypothetical protein